MTSTNISNTRGRHRLRRGYDAGRRAAKPDNPDAERPSAGKRLSFVVFNAMFLTSKTWGADKKLGIETMLQDLKWPGLVAITEIGKSAGTVDLRGFLGDNIGRQYDMVWSQRSIAIDGSAPVQGNKVGGGLALLVHKRLHLRISEFKLDVL